MSYFTEVLVQAYIIVHLISIPFSIAAGLFLFKKINK